MFLNNIACTMFHYYLKLFIQKRLHYISWNILFLWGFGLWIALCTSNIFHSDILSQEAVILYQQNWNSESAYNSAITTETKENVTYITTNCTLYNIVVIVATVIQYIYILLLVCFIIPLICLHEHIKKRINIPSNIINNFHSISTCLKIITSDCKKNYILDQKIVNKNDCILHSELIEKCEISAYHLQGKLIYEWKKGEYALEGNKIKYLFNANINIVQNEIIISNCTLLFFDNYELYHYFNNQQLKNTCNLLTKHSIIQNSKFMGDNKKFLINCKKNNLQLKKGIQKGIISSSPEFQQFLANLKKSRFFYP